MSFEMKYDRDGKVISAAPEQPQEVAHEPVVAPVEIVEYEEPAEVVEPEELEPVQEVPQETAQAKNFRAIKEKAERAERERDEYFRRVKELELQAKPVVEAPDEEDKIDIGDDDLVEGKHLRKYAKEIKQLKKELESTRKQTQESVVEARIKMKYPDFDSVVTQENLQILSTAYPELAETLRLSQNNPEAQASSAYTMIKKFVAPPDNAYKADVERAKRNAAKPRPLASVSPQQGESPLSKANAFANGLTDELKAQLYREMLDARR